MVQIGDGAIFQIGILVRDIDAAAEAWASVMGVEKPPIDITDEYKDSRAVYNGEPTTGRCKVAHVQCGPMDVELIEPDDRPTIWRDCLDKDGKGLHHVAFKCDDMDKGVAVMESLGFPLVQRACFDGGQYAYFDSVDKLKTITELLYEE